MKKYYIVLCILSVVFLASFSEAQVTNLMVNGMSSNFSVAQGDSFQWQYNLSVGGTASGQIWVDLNANSVIDSASDLQIFETFSQTDGQSNNQSGPGDMDGLLDGHILFNVPVAGFAPAHYILKFTNNDVGASIAGTVSDQIFLVRCDCRAWTKAIRIPPINCLACSSFPSITKSLTRSAKA